VAIKSFPELNKNDLRKVDELKPDYVFILDKPRVSNDFLQAILEKNIPIVWIDHHIIDKEFQPNEEMLKQINYFNSAPSCEPTTYLAYKTFRKKDLQWLSLIGCIGDNFLPDFAEEFAEKNSEIFQLCDDAFDCMYKTEIGKVATMLNFGLKDTTTNVLKMIYLLSSASGPQDILEENAKTKQLHKKYSELSKFMEKILKKANTIKNIILLEYSGQTSMSSELSNKLIFENKNKIVLVIFKKSDVANVSIRGKYAKRILLQAIKEIGGAIGGGHDEASGARIPIDKLEEFKKNIFDAINSNK
jgi:nanoRNase/pAp phosphatase (c-di-AMP/oligoRNAs hydrolase)